MMGTESKPNNLFLKRISRLKIIIFLKRNLLLFSLILLFLLTIIFNLWDIKKYNIQNISGEDIDQKVLVDIEGYLEKNVTGRNYFILSPKDLKKDLYANIPYIKSLRMEKVIPNKLDIYLDLFEPKYIANLKSDNCYLISTEGYVLENLCNEAEEGCCLSSSLEGNYIYLEFTQIDISELDDGKKKLLLIDDVQSVMEIMNSFSFEIDRVVLQDEVLDFYDKDGKLFRFTISENLYVQIARFVVVINKIGDNGLNLGSLDLRFERPVVKE